MMALLPKFIDPDADIRYMSLNDLTKMLVTAPHTVFLNDVPTCNKLVDGLIQALDDKNGEVQNQSLKWSVIPYHRFQDVVDHSKYSLEPLASKAPTDALSNMIEKLVSLKPENSMDSSIPATALRTLLLALPHPVSGVPERESKATQEAFNAISKVLIPRLLGYVVIPHGSKGVPNPTSGMLDIHPQKGADSDALEVAIELLRHYGPMLRDPEKLGFQTKLLQILDDKRTTNLVKKKVVSAISVLAIYMTDSMLESLMSKVVKGLRNCDSQPQKRRLLTSTLGSLGRSIPSRIVPYLPNFVPLVLKPLSQAELAKSLEAMGEDGSVDADSEEVKEAALVTLEALISTCSFEMRALAADIVDASLRFITYDPAMVTEDGDDAEMEGADDNEDENGFEEEAGMSDDDDGSWKIRRGAAKVLYAVINAHNAGDELSTVKMFEKIAPVLVKAFKDREESVRLESLTAMAMLVKKAGEDPSITLLSTEEDFQLAPSAVTKSRKRRREGSDASMFDASSGGSPLLNPDSRTSSPGPTSPRHDLSKYSPTILSGVTKLILSKSIPTILASTTFLRNFARNQPGGLTDQLGQIIPPIVDFASGSGSTTLSMTNGVTGGASSSSITLRIECLQLLATICDAHKEKAITPHAIKIAVGLLSAVKDSYFKVSSEAFRTVESFVVVLMSADSASLETQSQKQLSALSDAAVERIVSSDSDLEVRQRAIHTLGTMLSKSMTHLTNNYFTAAKQQQALDTLYDRLKLEITRLDAVQAIDTVASSLGDKPALQASWVRKVSLELAAQLRKADRILRSASLRALKRLIGNAPSRSQLDETTIQQLVQMLLPLVVPDSLDLLSPTLDSLTDLIKHKPRLVVNANLHSSLCALVITPLSGHAMESYLLTIKTLGESGAGQPVMNEFLQNVAVRGDPAVMGAAIGTLLVSSGTTIEVRTEDFINEVRTAQDDQRRCLALSVLGEASLRLGNKSPVTPGTFTEHFTSKSEQVCRTAAMALGRAGAGNVSKYIPIILGSVDRAGNKQYLLLHTIKELLQYISKEKIDISPYSLDIWKKLTNISTQEDNKAVGAECIGRLVGIEPKKYLPLLQVSTLYCPHTTL